MHQAVADPVIRPLVERVVREAAAATRGPASGIDAKAYASQMLERFANSALDHRLLPIAMDGSHNIPQHWLEPLAINQRAGWASPATLAAQLAQLWQSCGKAGIAAALFGQTGPFAASRSAAADALERLGQRLA